MIPSLLRAMETAKARLYAEIGIDLESTVLVVDNSDLLNRDNYVYLNNFFSNNNINNKIWQSSENLGFSKAYNLMMNFAVENKFDNFLMINPDVLLDDHFILELLKKSKQYPGFSALAPLILYWDFLGLKKTNIIDSCGLGIKKTNYFFDRGQGHLFEAEKFKEGEIFGFTGAGALLNLDKISLVARSVDNNLEFFDEMMFMYKEDVDLSYRLQLFGLKILFVPQAIMYHNRTLSLFKGKLRSIILRSGTDNGRRYSLLNHLIIMYKIRKLPFSLKIKIYSNVRLFFIFIYSLLFQNKQLIKFIKMKKQIDAKGLYLEGNIDTVIKIEGFMSRSVF